MSQGGAGVLESSTVGTVCITYLPPSILGVKFHMRLQVHAVGRRQRSRSGARALGCFSLTSCALRPAQPLAQAELPRDILTSCVRYKGPNNAEAGPQANRRGAGPLTPHGSQCLCRTKVENVSYLMCSWCPDPCTVLAPHLCSFSLTLNSPS